MEGNDSISLFGKIWNFYLDGFKSMTWGRTLWLVVLLKVFILFCILRVFFFKPAMAGKTDEQKSEIVSNALTKDKESEGIVYLNKE